MHVEEVYVNDSIWIKIPGKKPLIKCTIVNINSDNIITATLLKDGIYETVRIDDGWIKKIEPSPNRDVNGRRVIVYCKD